MCRWTNGLITVTLDQVRDCPGGGQRRAGNRRRTADDGGPDSQRGSGRKPDPRVRRSQRAATGRLAVGREPGTEPEWSELEKSALTETGNILGCAYVNALTRLIGTNLIPSAPYFIQDYGASVLQQAVMTQALTSDRLLLCQIGFRRKEQLDWRVVFVPTQGMQEAMQRSLHAAMQESGIPPTTHASDTTS